MSSPAKPDRQRRVTDEITEFVRPDLEPGERVSVVVGDVVGPLPPTTPLIPLFGVIAMFTPWHRVTILVLTDRRLLVVRCGPIRPHRPRAITSTTPCGAVRVLEWRHGSAYSVLRLALGSRSTRLCIVSTWEAETAELIRVLSA